MKYTHVYALFLMFIFCTSRKGQNKKKELSKQNIQFKTKDIVTFPNINTKYEYADFMGKRLIIQNSLPKGGVKYTDPDVDTTFTTDGEQYYTEVGSGIINYKELFRHKQESGMEYFYVEQDQTKIPVYESIAKSYNNIRRMLKGRAIGAKKSRVRPWNNNVMLLFQ